jgi:putative DNA methylase
MTCPRLIEIALPIREISAESVRDKSLRHGHISTLHLWWARRPLAASRAVVFGSLVPDPDHPECPPAFRKAVLRLLKDDVPKSLRYYYLGRQKRTDADPYLPYKGIADTPRNRLLAFIAKWSREQKAFDEGRPLDDGGVLKQPSPGGMLDDRCLVKWETSDPANEQGQEVLRIARELIHLAYDGKTPVVLDPFAGGGAIPLEATRLGAQAIANDYNPVAYLILRATCEFPQKYGKPGTRTVEREEYGRVTREQVAVDNVLAYDVEYWAKWILTEARKQIGQLYPAGKDGKPVIAYLWARTAPCSNPACHAEIPLLKGLLVCNKSGKRVALTMSRNGKEVTFGIAKNREIRETDGTMIAQGRGSVRCPVCQQTTPVAHLRRAGLEGKLAERMVAVITDTPQGKDYRPVEPTDLNAFEKAMRLAEHVERPSEYIVPEINSPNAPVDAGAHRSISVDLYGFKTFGSLFNWRQLLAMQTFVSCAKEAIRELNRYEQNNEYRNAVAGYLGLLVNRVASFQSSLGRWRTTVEAVASPFGMQSIPMVWDYPEMNPLSDISGWDSQLEWISKSS